jgi:hypothetical protein
MTFVFLGLLPRGRGHYVPGAPIAAKVSQGPVGFRRNGRAFWHRLAAEERGGFTFVNDSESSAPTDQIEPDVRDFEIMLAGLGGTASASNYGSGPTGVQSQTPVTNSPGCAVTAQGTPDQTVAVAAGTARIGGRRVVVTAGNVSLLGADGTNPRIDIITVDTAGTLGHVDGAASADPVYPTTAALAGKCVFAQVYRAAGDNTIETADITDKRVIIPEPPWEDVTWYGAVGNDSTNNSTAIQAAIDVAADIAAARGRGRTVFVPHGIFRVNTALSIPDTSITIQGDGRPGQGSNFGSWISGNTTGMTIINDPEGASPSLHGWALKGIGICNSGSGITGVTGVKISGTDRYRIDDCVILSQADGNISTGIYIDAGVAGNLDNNWNLISRCEFRRVSIGIDGFCMPKILFCNFVPPTTGSHTAVRMLSSATDNAIHAQNGRIIGCEFISPASGGVGIHSQGSFLHIVGCHFEAGVGNTDAVHIKLEKVVGSNAQAGTRQNITACSFMKGATAIEIGTGVTDTFVGGIHAVQCTALVDNGSRTTYLPNGAGEIARLPTALDLPQVTAPASPASGSHRFYVDTADTTFKSKDSTGKISVYGSRTRSLFIDGSVFRIDAATGVKLGTPPNAVDGVQLADGLTSGAYCNFIMPVDVIAGTVTIRPIWAPGATDGTPHTVRWQMNIKVLNAADVTAAGTTVAWTGVSAARTINVEVLETGQASTGVSPAADDRVRLEIQRDGAHANDTYVGAVNLIGVRVDYQANN